MKGKLAFPSFISLKLKFEQQQRQFIRTEKRKKLQFIVIWTR